MTTATKTKPFVVHRDGAEVYGIDAEGLWAWLVVDPEDNSVLGGAPTLAEAEAIQKWWSR